MITVVGAGVSGLTTAITLRERGLAVQVIARDLPERTTSAVPAAMWLPYRAAPAARVCAWARTTLLRLRALAADGRSGIQLREGIEAYVEKHREPPWWGEATSWRRAADDELPPGTVDGVVFEGAVAETPIYLPWLRSRLERLGVTLGERAITALEDCGGDIVVNCSGLGARWLADDRELYPSKGQLVLLAPRSLPRYVVVESRDAITYVIPRGDAIVLGGSAGDGIEDLAADATVARGILERALAVMPALADAPVTGERVGLRPCRGEVRLERASLRDGRTVVHNYGHGGAGFTLSWGAAAEAADLVI